MKVFFIGTNQIHRLEKIMRNEIESYLESNEKNKVMKLIEDIGNILKSEVVYGSFIGLFNKKNLIYLLLIKIFRKKVICHWIGTDVLIAMKKPRRTRFLQKFINLNLSGSLLLKQELESIGILSIEEHIILDDINYEIEKAPEKHRVLVYLPTNNIEFYGGKYIEKLAIDFSNIEFYIVANENEKRFKGYNNIMNFGKVSLEKMEEIYKSISILIRLVEHDGLSLMLMEALVKGKEVIYSYDFPDTYKSNNYDDLKQIFQKIIEVKPKLNEEGAKYIKENFSRKKYINNLKKYFKELIGEKYERN